MYIEQPIYLCLAFLLVLFAISHYVLPRLFKGLSPGMRRFCAVPWLFVCYGALFASIVWLVEHRGALEYRVAARLCLLCAMALFAVWIGVFLPQVCRWRVAQQRFWQARRPIPQPAQTPTADATLPGWRMWLFRAAIVLAIGEACLLTCQLAGDFFRYQQWSRSSYAVLEVMAFPLLLTAIHYPIMWVALLVREFLSAESLYETLNPAEQED